MSYLNEPLRIRELAIKNRIVMPPMCQNAAGDDGKPNDWHFVHYASRAIGGAGLIIVEMTDITKESRGSDTNLGLWSDEQVPAFARLVRAVQSNGARIAIQIAHAGRKSEADEPVGPTEEPHSDAFKKPRALSTAEVGAVAARFADAARRAVEAGFDAIELHGAHGYLIHQFHSPAINKRTDEYGRDLARFGVEVVRAVKREMPAGMPLLMRVSAVEYKDGGYDIDHMIEIAKRYKEAGVDVFHVSSGGDGPIGRRKPGTHAGYQLPFARRIREAVGGPVIAVGNLDHAEVAEAALANGDADLVSVGRGMLRDPYWALRAIQQIDGAVRPPKSYETAFARARSAMS